MRRPFTAQQADLLEAITEALFDGVPMAITPHQVVENLQHQFSKMEEMPERIGQLMLGLNILLLGPLFTAMSVKRRRRILEERLRDPRLDVIQDMSRVRAIIYAGYYGHWEGLNQDDNEHNPVHKQIGFTLPKFRTRGPADVPVELVPGRDLTHQDIVAGDDIPAEVDVIVIGSGAGGSVAAFNLASQGHDVLILEAGGFYPSNRITHEERLMSAKLFKQGGIQSSKDSDFIVFQARCLGGGTVINNGIVLRLGETLLTHPDAEDVLATWDTLGAPIDRAAFEAAYDAVEQHLQVERISPRAARKNGPHLLEGWGKFAIESGTKQNTRAPALWFKKNYGPRSAGAECAYCGYCNTGCPYGRKHGMAQSYLRDARAKGARIAVGARVKRIVWDDEDDRVLVARAVDIDFEDGTRRRVRARRGVVVAAGTMASSRLLARSGIDNDNIGEGVSLNIACPMPALMPNEVRAWDEDQMSTYVDRGDFLIESHFQPPQAMASLMPGWFEDHAVRMRNYSRIASAGVLFPADRRGRVDDDGKLSFKLDAAHDLPFVRETLGVLARVHFANGAEEVYPATGRGPTLRPGDDIDAVLREEIREADDVTLSSSHPHGGNAMNADPALGVVGLDCRVHGTANVLVTDASVFPSCIRVNAQLTTMAMAHYATARGDPFAA